MIATYILIMTLASAYDGRGGGSSYTREFSSRLNCLEAGNSMAQEYARKLPNHTVVWGCFKK